MAERDSVVLLHVHGHMRLPDNGNWHCHMLFSHGNCGKQWLRCILWMRSHMLVLLVWGQLFTDCCVFLMCAWVRPELKHVHKGRTRKQQ